MVVDRDEPSAEMDGVLVRTVLESRRRRLDSSVWKKELKRKGENRPVKDRD